MPVGVESVHMADYRDVLSGDGAAELPTVVRDAGIAGAGGAGFPAYAKWTRLDEVDHLLVNHQESEPSFYKDRWLGRARAETFAEFFDALLDAGLFETVVVGAKITDRETWGDPLAAATDATVRTPEDLPVDVEAESGVVMAYTENRYQYGMESVLLKLVADVVMGRNLPMDLGWIVQNTESLYNVCRAVADGTPVTDKYVHVDGLTPRHRFLRAPVGTPATTLLRAADAAPADLGRDRIVADGGPGWCFETDAPPDRYGVRKRTNGLLVLDREVAEEHRFGGDRINVLGMYDWVREHETTPADRLTPERVFVPRITNSALRGTVFPSDPVVAPGDSVDRGDVIARPHPRGFSVAQHASIDGTVAAVTDDHVEIRAR